MASLIDYLSSSSYQKATNSLFYTSPAKIRVHVEDPGDITFWSNILRPYEKKARIKFDFTPYSQGSLKTGKQNLIKKFNDLGKESIVCLDSDYDYLLEHSETAKKIHDNPYVFQTYTYSIENFKCFSSGLSKVCTDATCSTTELINFDELFLKYSEKIHDLFVWNLYFYSINDTSSFTINDFSETIKLSEVNLEDQGTSAIEKLDEKVREKLLLLNSDFKNSIDNVEFLKRTIHSKNCTNTTTYLFAHGHTIFDHVALPVIKKVCNSLKKEHIDSIKCSDATSEEINNRLNHYKNLTKSKKTEDILFLNDNFKECHLYEKIKNDIDRYIQLHEEAIS